jgi:uncharacterized delta-60 repeat protein
VTDAAFQNVDGEQKIVVVGSVPGTRGATRWTVARYLADGSLDASFGSNGVVTGPVLDGSSPGSVAVQPDGKIVVSGSVVTKTYKNGVVGVVRYHANGSVDSSFGTAGVTAVPCSWSFNRCSLAGHGYSVVVQPDGKVVIAGAYYGPRLTVIRLTASGLADTSFNGNGQYIMTTALADAKSVVLQTVGSDVKIVAAGSYYGAGGGRDAAVFRFDADGSLDALFGTGGIATASFSSETNLFFAVALDANDKIVATGEGDFAAGPYRTILARFDASGSLDASFGTGGTVDMAPRLENDVSMGVVVQADGKVVLGGVADGPAGYYFQTLRYNNDGAADTTYGTGGWVTTAFPGFASSRARGILQQADGKVIVFGDANYSRAALARYYQ